MQRSLGLFLIITGLSGAAICLGVIIVLLLVGWAGNTAYIWSSIAVALGLLMTLAGFVLVHRANLAGTGVPPSLGRAGAYLIDVAEKRTANDQVYQVLYQQAIKPSHGNAGRVASLSISVPVRAPAILEFTKETRFDSFCKAVGLAREYQMGDREFDDAVYIRGPSFTYAELYLDDGDKRQAILDLLALGFTQVRLSGTQISATWTKFKPLVNDSPGLPERAAEELRVLANQVPAKDPGRVLQRTDRSATWIKMLWFFAICWAATLTFVFVYVPIRSLDLVGPSLTMFAQVFSIFVLVTALLLRGTSTSHDRSAPVIGWGSLLLALGSVGAVSAVNALADDGLPVHRKVIVLAKSSHTAKGITWYVATAPDWGRPAETVDFKISSDEYNRIVKNRTHLLLTTMPGRLGIEWLESSRVE